MKTYYEKIKFVKDKTVSYLKKIFRSYGNELTLKLEDCDLLQNKNNCIESSTATGFIMEEFIVSKLEDYSRAFDNVNDIRIERIKDHGTTDTSYDCYAKYQDVFFMINVKIDKGNNNAVSAINALHNDYVLTDEDKEKSFIVLKTKYTFDESKKATGRKIIIKGVSAYALEEIDFSEGHRQDHRNWSQKFKSSSGRLQVSKNFIAHHRLKEDEISYEKTKEFIEKIYNGN